MEESLVSLQWLVTTHITPSFPQTYLTKKIWILPKENLFKNSKKRNDSFPHHRKKTKLCDIVGLESCFSKKISILLELVSGLLTAKAEKTVLRFSLHLRSNMTHLYTSDCHQILHGSNVTYWQFSWPTTSRDMGSRTLWTTFFSQNHTFWAPEY